MKIIKKGTPPESPQPKWVGITLECDNCGTIVELQATDIPSVTTERRVGGRSTITIDCPICKADLTWNGVL